MNKLKLIWIFLFLSFLTAGNSYASATPSPPSTTEMVELAKAMEAASTSVVMGESGYMEDGKEKAKALLNKAFEAAMERH